MVGYFVGTDLKFKLGISCTGFSMADDDFSVTLVQGNVSIVVTKDEMVEDAGDYYLLVDTTQFKPGELKMIVTAYVPDDDFPGGTRREVNVAYLCSIKKTV